MNLIQQGSFLTLHYRLAGPDGADVVNTFDDKPAPRCRWAPASWRRRWSAPARPGRGRAQQLRLAAGDAFGERNPDMLQRVALSLLRQLGDPDAEYGLGDVVQFPTPDGQGAYAGVVREVGPDWLLFDFNHPLAGQAGALRSAADRGAVMAGLPLEEVVLAEPRGFCAGVDRAIEIVERALAKFGAPIYVRHEIVHNTYVVNDLKAKGAIFIEDLADVPPGATLVFSAHGVSQGGARRGRPRGFQVFDATCPLVTKVHVEVAKLAKEGYEFIMIGHKGHPEVEGTMGQLSEGIYLVEDVADVAMCNRAATSWRW